MEQSTTNQKHKSKAATRHGHDGHKLNKVTCRGVVPWVPWVTGYGPKFLIRSVPSNSKWMGNHTPHTRFCPTTPGRRGGATNLKRTKPMSNPHHHLPSLWLSWAGRISIPVSSFHLYPQLGMGPGVRLLYPGAFSTG
jgi:hypothetical protein